MKYQDEIVRVHIWVQGRVQAVGFRAFVQQNSAQIGVTGWVRNVGYDTVEGVAEGPKGNLGVRYRMRQVWVRKRHASSRAWPISWPNCPPTTDRS